MTKIVALFNEPSDLESALNQLALAELNDDIKEVIDSGAGDASSHSSFTVVPAGTGLGQAAPIPAFISYNDLGEEGAFFEDAVNRGGRLIILDTDENEKAKRVLQNANASRIYDSSS